MADRKIKRTLADLCGITPQAVAQWFDGSTKRISPDYLAIIAQRYDVNLDWLVTGQGDKSRPWHGLNVREPGALYGDDSLQEIIKEFPGLSKSGKHAVLSTLYRELEKAKQGEH